MKISRTSIDPGDPHIETSRDPGERVEILEIRHIEASRDPGERVEILEIRH